MLKRLCLVVLMFSLSNLFFSQEVQDTIQKSTNVEKVGPIQYGIASWYGGNHHGRKTANGSIFNQNALTCASNNHKFGTKLRVTNPQNGKSIVVTVTDRGGFTRLGRLLDLSKGAFAQLAPIQKGLLRVAVEIVE